VVARQLGVGVDFFSMGSGAAMRVARAIPLSIASLRVTRARMFRMSGDGRFPGEMMKLSYVMMLMVALHGRRRDVRAFKCTDAKGNAIFDAALRALADPPRPEAKADEAHKEFARRTPSSTGARDEGTACASVRCSADLARRPSRWRSAARCHSHFGFRGIEVSKTDS